MGMSQELWRGSSVMVQTVKLAESILIMMETNRGKNRMETDEKASTELDSFLRRFDQTDIEFGFDSKKNFEERLEFVRQYANWVKSVPNRVWSRQQAKLINSFMQNTKNFKLTPEQYLAMVKER